jgi:D-galactarolactone cycloisomerase
MYSEYNKELAEHKIVQVEWKRVYGRYPRLHGKNAVKSYHGYGHTVPVSVVKTDSGHMGWGCLGRSADDAKAAVDIVGKSVAELFDAATGIRSESLCTYDIALHDLAGNILGIPVAKMLNPQAATIAKVYDGAIYMNDVIPEEKPFGINKIVEDCEYDYALGHRAFKIKIGRGFKWMEPSAGLKRDIEVTRLVHERFPDALILVDGNDGFTPDSMIEFVKGIGPCPLYWIEEPFREDEENNRKLRAFLDTHMPATLIADGESRPDIPQLFDLASKGLLDILQPDVIGYGFTPWRKLMKSIAEKGCMASPHAWWDVVKTHYCAHLAAAWPHNVPYIEAVLGETEGVDYSGYCLKNGVLHLPDSPGFGMELIWAEELS